jgi:hypothetical protein
MFSIPSTTTTTVFMIIWIGYITCITAFIPTTTIRTTNTILTAKKTVFIDGEAGTTGIQVRDRLGKRTDIEILSIPDELRKDVATRKQYINQADAVILCK